MKYVGFMAEKHERLRQAREGKFKYASEAAAALGISPSTYRAHENGQNDFHLEEAKVYAKKFGVDPLWLMAEDGIASNDNLRVSSGTPEPANAAITGVKVVRGPKIPLYGAAVGGEDGEFVLNGNHLDDIFAPPSLSGIGEAYAVQINGDSMWPRYEDGETVFVNPKRRPVKNDYVIAEIHVDENSPPLAYIKRLVRRTDKELVLEQFNPKKLLTFEGHTVKSVHYVLRSGE
ncbi:repressor protein C [Rhizobium phage RHph_I3_18]|nr:repressor protein C [Rhizobium phage RHph_I3_18]